MAKVKIEQAEFKRKIETEKIGSQEISGENGRVSLYGVWMNGENRI